MFISPFYHEQIFRHSPIVRQIVDFNLSSKQVKELCQADELDEKQVDEEQIPLSALKLAKVTQGINTTSPQDLARALMKQEGGTEMARARLQAMKRLIADAERYLED